MRCSLGAVGASVLVHHAPFNSIQVARFLIVNCNKQEARVMEQRSAVLLTCRQLWAVLQAGHERTPQCGHCCQVGDAVSRAELQQLQQVGVGACG